MNFSLLFVYNVESQSLKSVPDLAPSIIYPYTDRCNLFKLTQSRVGKKVEWKSYLNNLKISFDFLCKDEFLKKFPKIEYNTLPMIYIKDESELYPIADDFAIYSCESIKDLCELLDAECMLYQNEKKQKKSSGAGA